ncbi:hypothetical protein E6W39_04720 [Kitasatospora acidiphila]|uniref:YCII-related domain-containing protein n=1 Tax=Kitasatospora acidiphila TaxID=2567942 RepID=A0A540VY55_9ACTN|nr:YciI family protein [Kitasatospora acidiphila]TQF01679.1 hypothetical protein E6W39_04720 [Kitasatospora acidiphila]
MSGAPCSPHPDSPWSRPWPAPGTPAGPPTCTSRRSGPATRAFPGGRHTSRPTHREYLAELADDGRIALCGPLTSDTGGLLVFRAKDEAEVREMVDHDPYAEAGVLSHVRIEQWSPVLGCLAARL